MSKRILKQRSSSEYTLSSFENVNSFLKHSSCAMSTLQLRPFMVIWWLRFLSIFESVWHDFLTMHCKWAINIQWHTLFFITLVKWREFYHVKDLFFEITYLGYFKIKRLRKKVASASNKNLFIYWKYIKFCMDSLLDGRNN